MPVLIIQKTIWCDECHKEIPRQFRFTDWDNDANDVFGDWFCCLKWYQKAVKENPEGRCSIYAVTACDDCGDTLEDMGVLYNKKCPIYRDGGWYYEKAEHQYETLDYEPLPEL